MRSPSAKPVELILIGAGARGADSYGTYALDFPRDLRFVAVAEPDAGRCERFARAHRIAPDRRFADWRELLTRAPEADAVLICTQDRLHVDPGIAALEAGYHVLLEKPLAPSTAGCRRLVEAAERTGRMLQVCHVLRYTPFFSRLHTLLEAGDLGDVMTVEHRENVAYWHMAHSYVRGNWRNSAQASPMLLAKCCHDLDVLSWNMGRPCRRLSSFGSNLEFRSDRVGPEVPDRCTAGCPIEPECQYSAIKIYQDGIPFGGFDDAGRPLDRSFASGWPTSVLTADPSAAGRRQAIETGPYGRCVYRCDNDQVDQQMVILEFEGGVSVSLAMHGHSHEDNRTMRYDGTRATLRGRFGARMSLEIHDHLTGQVRDVALDDPIGSHGGGDYGLMAAFVRVLRGSERPLTSARAALESHLLAFAAEEARRSGSVVELSEFRAAVDAGDSC